MGRPYLDPEIGESYKSDSFDPCPEYSMDRKPPRKELSEELKQAAINLAKAIAKH